MNKNRVIVLFLILFIAGRLFSQSAAAPNGYGLFSNNRAMVIKSSNYSAVNWENDDEWDSDEGDDSDERKTTGPKDTSKSNSSYYSGRNTAQVAGLIIGCVAFELLLAIANLQPYEAYWDAPSDMIGHGVGWGLFGLGGMFLVPELLGY